MKNQSNLIGRVFKGLANHRNRADLRHCHVTLTILAGGLIMASMAWGQTEAPPPPPIREPLPPKVQQSEDPLDQEVVIRQEEGRIVEEYRRNGQVHMVRIVPDIGQPYYMIDTTGDGLLDMKHDTFEPVKPVYWRLFEW